MENTKMTLGNRVGKGLVKVGQFIQKHSGAIACCLAAVLLVGKVAFADEADDMWDTMTKLVSKWAMRLGGVVLFVGGVMFALGWKDDNADGKTRGINTMIAGAMVIAVAALANTFFNLGGGNGGTNESNESSTAYVQMVDEFENL